MGIYFKSGELEDKDTFIDLVQSSLSPEVGEKVMTIAEQLRREGEARGEARGESRGIEKQSILIAKRLLSEGMELSFIAKITQLTLDQINQLKNKMEDVVYA